MLKVCENCKQPFKTHDSRRKACSNTCGNILRKTTQLKTSEPAPVKSSRTDALFSIVSTNLPPPEELPAPYAKRVHDMWAALTGNGDVPTRIA